MNNGPVPTSNEEVAQMIGVHKVTVARMRSGARKPSTKMMYVIQEKLGWGVNEQMAALNYAGDPFRYAREFQGYLEDKYHIRRNPRVLPRPPLRIVKESDK